MFRGKRLISNELPAYFIFKLELSQHRVKSLMRLHFPLLCFY